MKPTVLLHDTRDDRRQAHTALLRGLSPSRCVAFLDWTLSFARAVLPPNGKAKLLANAVADRTKMADKIREAERGCPTARLLLANEIYGNIAVLSHHFDLEWLPVVEELEKWAKGRPATPVAAAASAWHRRLSLSAAALPAASPRSPGTAGSGRPAFAHRG